MPRKTESAALYLAAVIVVVIGALAFMRRTVPAELPVALIALVTASAGVTVPSAINQLLERLAAGLTPTPAEADPAVQQLVAQALVDRIQPPAPAATPAPPAPPAAVPTPVVQP